MRIERYDATHGLTLTVRNSRSDLIAAALIFALLAIAASNK